ncbi:unnamed protein product [Meloidogyne enterolobii]|uniref:Uncharacterized protein n=1 Tax=Meloidogyne enterolobii TaxID=390850 RepID=A0ACB1AU85_MELEN
MFYFSYSDVFLFYFSCFSDFKHITFFNMMFSVLCFDVFLVFSHVIFLFTLFCFCFFHVLLFF